MKCKILVSCLLVFADFVMAQERTPAAYNSSSKVNYIRTWTAASPENDPAVLIVKSLQDVRQTTEYFDGLARPIQTVTKKGSLVTGAAAIDYVMPIVYDELGREKLKYLPFAANNTGGNTNINNGIFKLNPFQQDSVFNKQQFPGETYYYNKNNYEASPLNRVVDAYAPGNSWVGSESNGDPNARRNISSQYLVNDAADSVRIWNLNGAAFTTSRIYPVGSLTENVTVNEHKQKTVEYKNTEGQLILRKVQKATTPSSGHYGWLCTYFIYDAMGQLRLVVQPKGVEMLLSGGWTVTANILNDFCFRYEYDELRRMVIKKIPGIGEAWMVYDSRDRLVLMQDSVKRSASQWIYTQYDVFNRPITTGIWTNGNDRVFHYTQAKGSTAYPSLSGQTFEELTNTYYDDYQWASYLPATVKSFDISYANSYFLSGSGWPYPQLVQQSTSARGLTTGSRQRVLGSSPSQMLATVNFYDDKDRLIQSRSQNVTGGVDVISTQYNWNGQPLVIAEKHEKAGSNYQTHIIVSKYEYDSLGRVLKIRKTVSSNFNGVTVNKPEQVIVSNEYDALGRLAKKVLGSPVVDSVRYAYNIRGWLLGANRDYAKDIHQNNYFGFDLGYDKTNNSLIGNQSYTAAQYNGNIAGTVWKSKGDGEKRKYDYSYDAANMLLRATFTQYSASSFNTSSGLDFTLKDMSYDANGNILSMTQRGWKFGGSVTIDSLLYNYENSNKLKSVVDRSNDPQTKLGDFRSSSLYMTALGSNKPAGAVDYVYDGNGNMVKDRNKDMGDANNSGIVYNQLDLPSVVTFRTSGGAIKGTVSFAYSASGQKLKKIIQQPGQPDKTFLYLGGAVYENDTLQLVLHEEGRFRYARQYYLNGSSAFKYFNDYFLKDHLGNVRMVLTEQQDTAVYMATMEAAYRAKEFALFSNVPETSYPKTLVPGGYPVDNTTSPNDSVARVNGSGRKVGPSLVLKVMSGDKVDLAVKSFYRGSGAAGPVSDPLADILSALAGGIVGTTGETKGTFTELNNPVSSPLAGILNSFRTANNPTPATKPKAYLNWILLDEQLQYVSPGSGAAVVGNTDEFKTLTTPSGTLTIPKNGFLYIYVSNETLNRDVFFDNLSVKHTTGSLLEETHYYPYGLTMAAISTRAAKRLENKYEYNGKEKQDKELSDGNGLEWYDYEARMYDCQIGRWFVCDPLSEKDRKSGVYNYVFNNPITFVDPDGKFGDYYQMDGTYLGSDGKNDNKVYAVENGAAFNMVKEDGTLALWVHKSKVTDITAKTGITHTEFLQFAANVYNETSGMVQKEKDKIASAMMNRKENKRYKSKGWEYMLDRIMFNDDSHSKKMTETDRKPGNDANDYPGHDFTYQDVSAEKYREFFNTKAVPRNAIEDMKGSVMSSINQLYKKTDLVKGANSWVGNGLTHRFKTIKNL